MRRRGVYEENRISDVCKEEGRRCAYDVHAVNSLEAASLKTTVKREFAVVTVHAVGVGAVRLFDAHDAAGLVAEDIHYTDRQLPAMVICVVGGVATAPEVMRIAEVNPVRVQEVPEASLGRNVGTRLRFVYALRLGIEEVELSAECLLGPDIDAAPPPFLPMVDQELAEESVPATDVVGLATLFLATGGDEAVLPRVGVGAVATRSGGAMGGDRAVKSGAAVGNGGRDGKASLLNTLRKEEVLVEYGAITINNRIHKGRRILANGVSDACPRFAASVNAVRYRPSVPEQPRGQHTQLSFSSLYSRETLLASLCHMRRDLTSLL